MVKVISEGHASVEVISVCTGYHHQEQEQTWINAKIYQNIDIRRTSFHELEFLCNPAKNQYLQNIFDLEAEKVQG